MRDPGLAEHLPSESARIRGVAAAPGVFQVLRVRTFDLECVRCRSESHHRSAAIEIVGDVLHLGVGEILDRKSTRLNSSHSQISYAVFCLKKKKKKII